MSDQINLPLIALCLSKNGEAQRKLYNLLLPYLNVMCKRYLVNGAELKDVLQDTFIHIFKNLHQFDVQKASFKTWTTKIAINNCFKYNAKNNRNSTEELIIDLHESKVNPTAYEKISNEEMLVWLKKMPRNYFDVFNMFVIDDFSHDEIAKLLDIDTALSRQRLSRARGWLKKRLQTDDEFQFNFSFN
ncbi:MAG: RNA polymerase sigma-70 factor (ECF subfamily) [Granulosicoccus sp.]